MVAAVVVMANAAAVAGVAVGANPAVTIVAVATKARVRAASKAT